MNYINYDVKSQFIKFKKNKNCIYFDIVYTLIFPKSFFVMYLKLN